MLKSLLEHGDAPRFARFLINWAAGKLRHDHLTHEYLALIFESELEPHVRVYARAFVCRARIGRHSYVGAGSQVVNAHIGRFTSIGSGCVLGLGVHPTRDFVSTHPIFYSTRGQSGTTFADRDYFDESSPLITIGHDVWIGQGVIVRGGVTIGNGAILATGSIITKDVPPYAIVGGAPAQLIRHRFDEPTRAALEASRWWDRDDAWLRANFRRFHDVARFVAWAQNSDS
jgi:acetyltransferase-like isoleucine patch superfamily enzyme